MLTSLEFARELEALAKASGADWFPVGNAEVMIRQRDAAIRAEARRELFEFLSAEMGIHAIGLAATSPHVAAFCDGLRDMLRRRAEEETT